MSGFLILLLCILLGLGVGHIKSIKINIAQYLNRFIVYVSLPALVLLHIPKLKFSWEMLIPVSMAWIVFGIATYLFSFIGKKLRWSKATIGCLILVCGLGNTSFVGLPLLDFFYGKEALKIGLLIDQAGSFLVLATLGIITAGIYSEQKPTWEEVVKKIITFPPFVAFGIALLLVVIKPNLSIEFLLIPLGGILTPLALFSVGLQLKFNLKGVSIRAFSIGLAYKLIVAPLLIFMLFKIVLQKNGLVINTTILEAAMAPMISATIVANQMNLNPKLANFITGFGIPISFVTVFVWWFLLK